MIPYKLNIPHFILCSHMPYKTLPYADSNMYTLLEIRSIYFAYFYIVNCEAEMLHDVIKYILFF